MHLQYLTWRHPVVWGFPALALALCLVTNAVWPGALRSYVFDIFAVAFPLLFLGTMIGVREFRRMMLWFVVFVMLGLSTYLSAQFPRHISSHLAIAVITWSVCFIAGLILGVRDRKRESVLNRS
jgi:hypothetical protein